MNYEKIYYQLIESRRFRSLRDNIYYEKHHILPKSLGGSNDQNNIVLLTIREHFVAHRLLFKFKKGTEKQKMGYALHRMCFANNNNQSKRKILSKEFEKIKVDIYSFIRGENHPCFGKPTSDEKRKKCSDGKIGEKNPSFGKPSWNSGLTKESSDIIMNASIKFKENYVKENHPNFGKSRSIETKEKISAVHKGVPKSEEHKEKLRQANIGKRLSAETIEKIKAANTGKPQVTIKCPHCGKEGGKGAMLRWHFDNCKFKDDTCVGIGPDWSDNIDKITKGLRLLD